MRTKHGRSAVVVILTMKEAEAMLYALGNTTAHWDILENVMNSDGRKIQAALRGHAKLSTAIVAVRNRRTFFQA